MPETAIANSRTAASTKDEHLALVERRFRAADPDGDNALDAKELGSEAGQALMKHSRSATFSP
jgi:hypothetical protein